MLIPATDHKSSSYIVGSHASMNFWAIFRTFKHVDWRCTYHFLMRLKPEFDINVGIGKGQWTNDREECVVLMLRLEEDGNRGAWEKWEIWWRWQRWWWQRWLRGGSVRWLERSGSSRRSWDKRDELELRRSWWCSISKIRADGVWNVINNSITE